MSKKSLERKADTLWAKIIKARNPVCQLCKKKASANAHHIMDRRHKHTRHDLRNGLALCISCHWYVEGLFKADNFSPYKHSVLYATVMEGLIDGFQELEKLAKQPIKYNEAWLRDRINALQKDS